MTTKKDKDRVNYVQELKKTSRYKLRKICSDRGVDIAEIRAAEASEDDAEDKMISLILAKYDEEGGAASSTRKSSTKRKAKKDPEPPPETEEDEDELNFDSDDGDDDGYGIDFDDDDDGQEAEETETEPEEEVTRTAATEESTVTDAEQSALEEKIDQLLDMQVTMAETVVALEGKVNKLAGALSSIKKTTLFTRTVVEISFSRIFKLGAGEPIKAFGKIREKAYDISGLKPPTSSKTAKK